ncbi:hypothetical protein BH20VER3_BH20VER3_07480 [soil metagenome]
MEKRPFGQTGMEVSVLGFGGAEIGLEGVEVQTVEQLLSKALDAGLNVIDTAECYGESESLIGQAVSSRRDDFYLFTKCGHPHGMESEANWTRESILRSIERSLRRLQTDRVDLVHLHSCPEKVLRKGDAIAALQIAREKGYTRFIGYSGDGHAARYAIECGAFDSLQTSIKHRRPGSARPDTPTRPGKQNRRHREAAGRECRLEDRRQTEELLSPDPLGSTANLALSLSPKHPTGEFGRAGAALYAQCPGRLHCDRRDDKAGTLGGKRPAPRGGIVRQRGI